MKSEGLKRKLVAILAADVEGYTRLMDDDEVATLDTLRDYRNAITAFIDRHRGRVVSTAGDSLLAEFESVVAAVQCAAEIQTELQARNVSLPEERRMEFRIGINLGDGRLCRLYRKCKASCHLEPRGLGRWTCLVLDQGSLR